MIINELAYKVTIKAAEFLNGKRKVKDEVSKLNRDIARAEKEVGRELEKQRRGMEKFSKTATTSFRNVYTAAAGFLGIGAGLYGIKQLFTSTANEIVRASQQAKFFGSDVNKMFGLQRGFKQAGLNADPFIAASGNARMALANIADPTVMGGLTGAAQNLLTLGARTGLNINNLGDPSKALAEFTRYSKTHSQENLMQVMAAAGFDPSDAAKIKSGELKRLVDSETKKSNITAQQIKKQENVVKTLEGLNAELDRVKIGITTAFSPVVIDCMERFGKWLEEHEGDIEGFFSKASDKIAAFIDAVGGANALLLLLAAGLRKNPIVLGAMAVAKTWDAIGDINADAKKDGKNVGKYMYDKVHEEKKPFLTWEDIKSFFGGDQISKTRMDDVLHGIMMTESHGDPWAFNEASGAAGAYQFKPKTAREYGLRVDSQVDERFNPEKARAAASAYMGKLLKKYNGNLDDALMAYNWGMGNVDQWIKQGRGEGYWDDKGKWRAVPKEAREYVGKVYGNMGSARHYYGTQGRLADAFPYQLSSSGGQPQINNSTHIGTVVVNSNPQSVNALTQSVNDQVRRASTNQAFSSGVMP